MRKHLARLTKGLSDLLLIVSALGLIAMTAIISWQVFGRYVLKSSPSWSEQAALTLMIWFISLAAAAGVRENFHIRIEALESIAPRGIQKVMRAAANLIVCACGIAMLVYGTGLVMKTWDHVIPSLGISRGLAYLGLPIAGALMALFALEKAFSPPEPPPPAEGA